MTSQKTDCVGTTESVSPVQLPQAKPTERHILILDDVALLGRSVMRTLRNAGYVSEYTDDPWHALERVSNGQVALLITDLMMPTMTGEEVIHRLKAIAPELPCLVMTGHATRARALALTRTANVVDILLKPWNPTRLLSTISRLIPQTEPRQEDVAGQSAPVDDQE